VVTDIFDFWAKIDPDAKVHPADRDVFDRLGSEGHGFNHKALPACFMGPLRTARVVLLYISPGTAPQDEAMAETPNGRNHYVRLRQGNEPLPSADTHMSANKWWAERTKCFSEDQALIASKVTILNIGAYHSKEMLDPELLAALPSSRLCLDWAQSVLFPEALAGTRVVVCLRAAKFWGLKAGKHYDCTLFAPKVNRSGHMVKCPARGNIIKAVQTALNSNEPI